MDSNVRLCIFCKRNVYDVDPTNHYFKAETNEAICKDCGWSAADETTKAPLSNTNTPAEQDKPIRYDIGLFKTLLPILVKWRIQQVSQDGLVPSELTKIPFEVFLLRLENRINFIKSLILQNKRSDAYLIYMDLIVTGLSYFEGHIYDLPTVFDDK